MYRWSIIVLLLNEEKWGLAFVWIVLLKWAKIKSKMEGVGITCIKTFFCLWIVILFNCEWALLVVTETGGEGFSGDSVDRCNRGYCGNPPISFFAPRARLQPSRASLTKSTASGGKKPLCLLCGLHIFSVFTSLGFLGWKLCLKHCSIWVGSKCLSMSSVILHTTAEVPESRCPVWPQWLPLKGIGVYPESPPS